MSSSPSAERPTAAETMRVWSFQSEKYGSDPSSCATVGAISLSFSYES